MIKIHINKKKVSLNLVFTVFRIFIHSCNLTKSFQLLSTFVFNISPPCHFHGPTYLINHRLTLPYQIAVMNHDRRLRAKIYMIVNKFKSNLYILRVLIYTYRLYIASAKFHSVRISTLLTSQATLKKYFKKRNSRPVSTGNFLRKKEKEHLRVVFIESVFSRNISSNYVMRFN